MGTPHSGAQMLMHSKMGCIDVVKMYHVHLIFSGSWHRLDSNPYGFGVQCTTECHETVVPLNLNFENFENFETVKQNGPYFWNNVLRSQPKSASFEFITGVDDDLMRRAM